MGSLGQRKSMDSVGALGGVEFVVWGVLGFGLGFGVWASYSFYFICSVFCCFLYFIFYFGGVFC